MTQELIHLPGAGGREQQLGMAVAAWLHAKQNKSSSVKTSTTYSATMSAFREKLACANLDLASDPAAVALTAQAFAAQHFEDASKKVAPATYNQRLAIISSFYQYVRKMGILEIGVNPIDRVERRSVQAYSSAGGLEPGEIKKKLDQVDRSTLAGARDFTLLMVALTTGRRLAEVAGLRLGDIKRVGSNKLELHFRRCKGGKEMRDVLAAQVAQALGEYLKQIYPSGSQDKEAPIWVSLQPHDGTYGQALSTRSLQVICDKRLGTGKFHSLRHTFAHTMEDAGAKVSDIQAKLGHSSLAITGRYLAALKQAENEHADLLAGLFGA
jgi:integrase